MLLVGAETFFWLTLLSGLGAVGLGTFLYVTDGPVFATDWSITKRTEEKESD